ncbi:Cytochrome c oxidase subunit 2 [Geodia barretti]|uniref:Cytochrome c oxidase subunit 2 n=1 Tax=Geodia barretti TaxID=519541 RepID=A0AA35SVM9_GEOBA|nr:Cytochrome c oxidase subunit 2 [Geodia barretti]
MQNWLTSSKFTKLALPVLALAATLFIAACSPGHPQSTFGYAGPVARDQGDLFLLIFWIAVAVFIVVEGGIIYIAIRYRRRDDKIPKQVHGNTKLEITWTVIPSLVVAAIAVPTIIGIWEQQRGAPTDMGDVLEVEAIGHRWPVNVKLASQDVIHSFWVPKLAGKVDMVPLNDNLVWFIADEPGIYDGQCAEFCGIAHAHMRFRVVAHEEEGFQEFDIKIGTSMQAHAAAYQEREDNKINLSNQEVENIADYLLALEPGDISQLVAPAITGGTPEERGEQLFISIGCNACHSLDADTTIVGPSLIGIADRAGTRTSLSADDYMRQSINDPGAFLVDGFTNAMVVPKIPPNQVDDLIAYISTLE